MHMLHCMFNVCSAKAVFVIDLKSTLSHVFFSMLISRSITLNKKIKWP